jgi:hypothetical protein
MPEHFIRKILGITLFALGINFMVNPIKAKPKPVETHQAVVIEQSKHSTSLV